MFRFNTRGLDKLNLIYIVNQLYELYNKGLLDKPHRFKVYIENNNEHYIRELAKTIITKLLEQWKLDQDTTLFIEPIHDWTIFCNENYCEYHITFGIYDPVTQIPVIAGKIYIPKQRGEQTVIVYFDPVYVDSLPRLRHKLLTHKDLDL